MDPITIISLATGAIQLGESLYQFITKQRATLQQTGEWTEDQENAFLQLLETRSKQAQWQQTPAA